MVNTFMTSTNMKKNFKNLDNKRLGNQRNETKLIINVLEGKSEGYKNHTAVRSFLSNDKKTLKNNIQSLKIYFNHCLREWIKRGNKNNMEFYDIDEKYVFYEDQNGNDNCTILPWFFSFRPYILSHRASLLRKDKLFYENKFIIDDELKPYINKGYFWPCNYEEMSEDNFKFEMLENLHDFSYIEIEKWITDKTRNPKTGRKISENKSKTSLYYKLDQARIFYGL